MVVRKRYAQCYFYRTLYRSFAILCLYKFVSIRHLPSFHKWIQVLTTHPSGLQSIQMHICLFTSDIQIWTKLYAMSMKKILQNTWGYLNFDILLVSSFLICYMHLHSVLIIYVSSGEAEKGTRRKRKKEERKSRGSSLYNHQGRRISCFVIIYRNAFWLLFFFWRSVCLMLFFLGSMWWGPCNPNWKGNFLWSGWSWQDPRF